MKGVYKFTFNIYIYTFYFFGKKERGAEVEGWWCMKGVYKLTFNIYVCMYVRTYIHTYVCVYIYFQRLNEANTGEAKNIVMRAYHLSTNFSSLRERGR